MDVHPPTVRFSRGVLATLAAFHVVFAYGSWETPDLNLWAAWPVMFLTSAVACSWAAWRFGSPQAMALAAAMTVTSYASRAAIVVVSWANGEISITDGHVVMATGCWLLLTVMSAVVFTRGMSPLSARYRNGDT